MVTTTFLGIPALTVARTAISGVSVMGVALGIYAIRSPASYAQTFGFPASSPVVQSGGTNPFIPIAGGRAITMSVAMLGCALFLGEGADRAIGVLTLAGLVTCVVDGLSLQSYAALEQKKKEKDGGKNEVAVAMRKKAMEHFGFVPAMLALGGWLVYAGEKK